MIERSRDVLSLPRRAVSLRASLSHVQRGRRPSDVTQRGQPALPTLRDGFVSQFKMAAQEANTCAPYSSTLLPNYASVKASYLVLIKNFAKSGDLNQRLLARPFSCDSISKIIDRIKYNGIVSASKLYEVIEENGKDVLIHRRSGGNKNILRLIGAEDCFDIIVEAHIISVGIHLTREETLRNIRKRYSIAKECVDIFLEICPECRNKTILRKYPMKESKLFFGFHYRVRLDIRESFTADGDFKYVLVYKDLRTQYVLLRPLISKLGSEIALEMMKIFSDFLVPGRIEACISNEHCIRDTMECLKKIWHPLNIVVEYTPTTVHYNQSLIQIMRQLKMWMEENGVTNLAMGCIYIQKKTNMTKTHKKGKPITHSVFGCSSNTDTDGGIQYDYTAVNKYNDIQKGASRSGSDVTTSTASKANDVTYISD